jgi:hypothetical protein
MFDTVERQLIRWLPTFVFQLSGGSDFAKDRTRHYFGRHQVVPGRKDQMSSLVWLNSFIDFLDNNVEVFLFDVLVDIFRGIFGNLRCDHNQDCRKYCGLT